MKILKKAFIACVVLSSVSTTIYAGCGIKKGSIRILSNDFPPLRAINSTAEECAGGKVTFTKDQTKEHKNIQVPALTSNPSQYTVAVVATSTLMPLLNNDLIRPLDGLVKKYGKGLAKNQLIRMNGKVMAVSFMVNSQHLIYRADILKKAGVEVPKTYEEVLAAAKKIKAKKLMKYPLASAYKAGWNLAEEFVNMYLGHGGEFFKKGSAMPSINNKKGIATLKMMKKLSKYMNPDYLTYDSNTVQASWEAGNVAIANFWGSRYTSLVDGKGSTKHIEKNSRTAMAPTVAGGNIPAASLWWDGFTVAKNISDTDAEASFRAMVHGTSAKMANANGDKAVWIIPGFKPDAKSKQIVSGVLENVKGGTKPYPMLAYMGLLHSTVGAEIVDYLQGKESAKKALKDAERAYITKAKEAGFLK